MVPNKAVRVAHAVAALLSHFGADVIMANRRDRRVTLMSYQKHTSHDDGIVSEAGKVFFY